MKLLTTGGLLYSTVQAQNADATYGTYQSFDYVATLAETQDEMMLASKVNVGWDPMVMQVIANYDGGKTLVGFGRTAATMYAGWVVKMWGEKGTTTPCGTDSFITGYVTMAVDFNSAISAATDCKLTSNAKTQWAFTSLASNGYAGTSASAYSVIYLNGAEESYCGS